MKKTRIIIIFDLKIILFIVVTIMTNSSQSNPMDHDHQVFHNYRRQGDCTGELTLYPAFRQNFVGVQFM